MEWIVFGVILGPVILSFLLFFLPGFQGRQRLIELSAVLFFLVALVLLIFPIGESNFQIPSIVWKFIILLAVSLIFAHSIRKKRYLITILTSVQFVILVLMEILWSPIEPVPFVQFRYDGKILFFAGSFVIALLVPLILHYYNQYFRQAESTENWRKPLEIGIFLLMASMVGCITANSITGLFLFWQWMYLANTLFFSTFTNQKRRKNPFLGLYIQQAVLTMWMAVVLLIYQKTGSLSIEDFIAKIGKYGEPVALIVFATVVVMGCFLPEKRFWKSCFSTPAPVTGLITIVFSLIVPIAVLLKFRALFIELNPTMISIIVVYGSFLVATAAFYAGLSRKAGHILAGMVMFIAGWGVATVFSGVESMFFSTGYTAVASITLVFLFACVTILESVKGTQDVEQMHLSGGMPSMTFFMSVVLTLFLFAPFFSALPRLVFLHFMDGNPTSVIFSATGFALVSALLFRWVSVILSADEKKDIDKNAYPTRFRIVLPIAFAVTIATNLLFGNLYEGFLGQPMPVGDLPARNIENLTELDGVLYLFRPGIGFVYLGGSLLLLTGMLFLFRKRSQKAVCFDDSRTSGFYHVSITAWLPKSINFTLWIRVGWITIWMLLVGVALSCLK